MSWQQTVQDAEDPVCVEARNHLSNCWQLHHLRKCQKNPAVAIAPGRAVEGNTQLQLRQWWCHCWIVRLGSACKDLRRTAGPAVSSAAAAALIFAAVAADASVAAVAIGIYSQCLKIELSEEGH